MENFAPDEQLLISKLKLLKRGDFDEHVKGELKVRLMREIAAGESELRFSRNIVILPRFAFRTALVGVLVLLVAGEAVYLAAKSSLPGDLLYPVKLAQEEAVLRLTRDPVKKTDLQAEFVSERAREARTIANSTTDSKAVEAALSRYKEEVRKVQQTASAVEREKAAAAVAKLSATVTALLEEAENQLAKEKQASNSQDISQKFVEAAQVSVTVLSEFIEDVKVGEGLDASQNSK
jgi:hypothetical protein